MTLLSFMNKKSDSNSEKLYRRSSASRATPISTLFHFTNRAVVSKSIGATHRGRIYYQDTYWFGCALNNDTIPEGTIVELLERRGNTWLVQPVESLSGQ